MRSDKLVESTVRAIQERKLDEVYAKEYLDFDDLLRTSWGQALNVLEEISEANMQDEFMEYIEEYFTNLGEGSNENPVGRTELNDYIAFEWEEIYNAIGLDENGKPKSDEDDELEEAKNPENTKINDKIRKTESNDINYFSWATPKGKDIKQTLDDLVDGKYDIVWDYNLSNFVDDLIEYLKTLNDDKAFAYIFDLNQGCVTADKSNSKISGKKPIKLINALKSTKDYLDKIDISDGNELEEAKNPENTKINDKIRKSLNGSTKYKDDLEKAGLEVTQDEKGKVTSIGRPNGRGMNKQDLKNSHPDTDYYNYLTKDKVEPEVTDTGAFDFMNGFRNSNNFEKTIGSKDTKYGSTDANGVSNAIPKKYKTGKKNYNIDLDKFPRKSYKGVASYEPIDNKELNDFKYAKSTTGEGGWRKEDLDKAKAEYDRAKAEYDKYDNTVKDVRDRIAKSKEKAGEKKTEEEDVIKLSGQMKEIPIRDKNETQKSKTKETLLTMQKYINEIYKEWDSLEEEVRIELDDQFNEKATPSYCLRWLDQAIDELLGDYDSINDMEKLQNK